MTINRESLSKLKLILFDVDGVMTDGRIVMDDDGKESKFFDVRDGHGIKLLMRAGLRVGIITGRQSRVVDHRAAELGIDMIYQDVKRKLVVYEKILAEEGLTDEEVAMAGDELVDLPVMRRVGLSLAPADAIDEVRTTAHYVCRQAGGHGAVREMAEFILKAMDRWDDVTTRYF